MAKTVELVHGYKFSRKNPSATSSMQMRKADGGTRGETVRGFGRGIRSGI
jgi:hypothetical protein